MNLSRSIYADKLAEFGTVAFAGSACTRHRGGWKAFFDARMGGTFAGRIVLEIGCYNAQFLSTIAMAYPTTAFVGLDWKCKQLYDGARHIVDRSLANIVLLRARAQDITTMFARDELDEIWIFHPEPCAEPRQLQNRLVSKPFLRDAMSTLREGGSVFLKTDHRDYYDWAATGVGGVEFHSPDYWNDPAALERTRHRAFAGQITAYERRFLNKKQPIHFVEWTRRGSLSTE